MDLELIQKGHVTCTHTTNGARTASTQMEGKTGANASLVYRKFKPGAFAVTKRPSIHNAAGKITNKETNKRMRYNAKTHTHWRYTHLHLFPDWRTSGKRIHDRTVDKENMGAELQVYCEHLIRHTCPICKCYLQLCVHVHYWSCTRLQYIHMFYNSLCPPRVAYVIIMASTTYGNCRHHKSRL